VFEDGVRREIRSFRLVAGSEVRADDERQAAEARAAAESGAPPSSARPPANPLRTVNLVCLVLNDLDSGPRTLGGSSRAFAFQAARRFVANELRPNTFIGIFTLDSSGMRPMYPFSNSRESLMNAIDLAARNQLPHLNLDTGAVLNGFSMLHLDGGIGGIGDSGSVSDPLGTKGDMGVMTLAALEEIGALKATIRQLKPLPFQKTVVLLSPGLTRPPDQLEYWDSMIQAAVDSGVTFYSVDVHGLDPDYDPTAASNAMLNYAAGLSRQQAATTQLPPQTRGPSPFTQQSMEAARQDDYQKFAVSSANQQEALRELAERTGGFLIANTNNVEPLLGRVMEEVDTHYEVAYPPASERDDGRFHKIELKLARANLRVEARGGYFAVPDATTHPLTGEEMDGLRALSAEPRPHAFDYRTRVYRFRDSGGSTQYAIAFEMPIADLTATPQQAAHSHRLHASLLALVKNDRGDIVSRFGKDVPSEVSDASLPAVRRELMTWQHAVSLPPGNYTVETAVVDHQGNRASTGVLRIENQPQPGLGASDLTLVRKLENIPLPPDDADPFQYAGDYTAKRVLPFVTTDLFEGAQPFVYFVIYPGAGNAAKPALHVRLLKDGRAIANLQPNVPAPSSSGAIPMVLELTAKPGRYEVRATVTQGGGSVERRLAYSIAASPAPPPR